MIDREMIHDRIKRLRSYLDELRPFASMDYKEYMDSLLHMRASERVLQLIVDTAIEINDHLLVESGLPAPVDYKTSFTSLVRVLHLDPKFLESISGSAGLRNVLVHEYAEVKAQKVFESIPQAIDEYTRYCAAVLKFVAKKKKRR